MKATLRWALPFAVTTAILAYLFDSIGFREVFAEVSLAATSRLIPVILLYVALSLWIEGLSLSRLTSYAGRHAATATCARIKAASYTVGLLNYALGVAALTVLFRRRVGLGVQAAAGMVITVSIIDLTMMMLIALAAAVLANNEDPVLQVGLLIAVVAVVAVGLSLLRAPFSLGPLDRLRDLEVFRTARGVPTTLLLELAVLRAAFVLVFIGAGIGSLHAFDVSVPIAEGVVGLSAVALVGAAPIAVSGLGTVQATVIYLFGDWGQRETLLACSLAMQAAMIAMRASVGLLFAGEFTREATEATRQVET